MNVPNTPPIIKGAINAAGSEIANVGQGVKNVVSNFKTNEANDYSNFQSGKTPYYAATNPARGTVKAFTSAFKKKANKK